MIANWGLFTDESGQGLVEYALILMFVALALVSALHAFRGQVVSLFQDTTDAFSQHTSS